MNTETEALKLALEALELMYACYVNPKWVSHKQQESQILEQTLATITAIKEALAQPERVWVEGYGENASGYVNSQPEPVAITITGKLGNIYSFTGDYSLKKGDKVYTTPPQRKPLTDEQINEVLDSMKLLVPSRIARAIEAAHNIFGDKK